MTGPENAASDGVDRAAAAPDDSSLGPTTDPSAVLPPGWAAPAVRTSLMTWAESFELMAEAGSPQWWARSTTSYPAQALLATLARRPELLDSLGCIPPGGRVLDVACGPGATTRLLMRPAQLRLSEWTSR